MSFLEHKIEGTTNKHLFNSEIENAIKVYAEEKNLNLPSNFSRAGYKFYSQQNPNLDGFKYCIVFLARPKTPEEILGAQIEFQIKQLEK